MVHVASGRHVSDALVRRASHAVVLIAADISVVLGVVGLAAAAAEGGECCAGGEEHESEC